MFTIILYCAAVSGLGVSLFKSRDKTRLVLKKAWKSFENILPQFLTVLLIIGILLSVFNKDMEVSLHRPLHHKQYLVVEKHRVDPR